MRASPGYAPPLAHGLDLDNAVETVPRSYCWDPLVVAPGEADFLVLQPRRTITVSRFVAQCRANPQAGATLVRFGLYAEAANGDLTMLARSANDPTVFSALAEYDRPMDTAGGFPASCTMRAGRRYRFSYVVVGSLAATSLYGVHANGPGKPRSPKTYRWILGQADLAASYADGALSDDSPNVVWGAMTP